MTFVLVLFLPVLFCLPLALYSHVDWGEEQFASAVNVLSNPGPVAEVRLLKIQMGLLI